MAISSSTKSSSWGQRMEDGQFYNTIGPLARPFARTTRLLVPPCSLARRRSRRRSRRTERAQTNPKLPWTGLKLPGTMPSSTRRLFAFNTSNLPPTRMHAECIYRLGNETKGELGKNPLLSKGKEKERNKFHAVKFVLQWKEVKKAEVWNPGDVRLVNLNFSVTRWGGGEVRMTVAMETSK